MKLYKEIVACIFIAIALSSCSLTNYGLYYRSDFVAERHYAKLKKRSKDTVLYCEFNQHEFSEKNNGYFFYTKNGKKKNGLF